MDNNQSAERKKADRTKVMAVVVNVISILVTCIGIIVTLVRR